MDQVYFLFWVSNADDRNHAEFADRRNDTIVLQSHAAVRKGAHHSGICVI